MEATETSLPAVGDRFMIAGAGHPRGHVYTVEEIRPSRPAEGNTGGTTFDCRETTKTGHTCESLYSLGLATIQYYTKRGWLLPLGPKPV